MELHWSTTSGADAAWRTSSSGCGGGGGPDGGVDGVSDGGADGVVASSSSLAPLDGDAVDDSSPDSVTARHSGGGGGGGSGGADVADNRARHMRHSLVSLRCNGDARCEVASATAFLSSSAGTASPLATAFATRSQ